MKKRISIQEVVFMGAFFFFKYCGSRLRELGVITGKYLDFSNFRLLGYLMLLHEALRELHGAAEGGGIRVRNG